MAIILKFKDYYNPELRNHDPVIAFNDGGAREDWLSFSLWSPAPGEQDFVFLRPDFYRFVCKHDIKICHRKENTHSQIYIYDDECFEIVGPEKVLLELQLTWL